MSKFKVGLLIFALYFVWFKFLTPTIFAQTDTDPSSDSFSGDIGVVAIDIGSFGAGIFGTTISGGLADAIAGAMGVDTSSGAVDAGSVDASADITIDSTNDYPDGVTPASPPDPESFNVCTGSGSGYISWQPSAASFYYTLTRSEVGSIPKGSGLLGQYFDEMDITHPVLTRVDPGVNFNWGLAGPDPTISPDAFSVKWVGKFLSRSAGTYTFYTKSYGGVDLYIDGNHLFHQDINLHLTENSQTITLETGKTYNIRLEYHSRKGAAAMELSWSGPGFGREIIPAANLFPSYSNNVNPVLIGSGITAPNQPILRSGITGQYYNGNFTGMPLSRYDSQINFNWGSSTPDPAIVNASNFSTKWLGKIKAKTTGTYTFYFYSVGAVALYINNDSDAQSIVIKKDSAASPLSESSGTFDLIAGQMYDFKLERAFAGVDGNAILSWSGPGVAKEVIPASQFFTNINLSFYPGLYGMYFDNNTFDPSPNFSKYDPEINFNWGASTPDPLIGQGDWGVRWLGLITPTQTGNYSFYATGNGNVKIYVNTSGSDFTYISSPIKALTSTPQQSHTLTLNAGISYPFKVEYTHAASDGDGAIRVFWGTPSNPSGVSIPTSSFTHNISLKSTTATSGLSARYFDNEQFNAHTTSDLDTSINSSNWIATQSGSQAQIQPDPYINPDTFSASWFGKIKAPETGTYTINAYYNEAFEIYLGSHDSALINDIKRNVSGVAKKSATISLTAGKTYNFRAHLKYGTPSSNSDTPFVKLTWKRPSSLSEEDIPISQYSHSKVVTDPLSFIDATASPNSLYLYQVAAVGAGGASPSRWAYNLTSNCTSPYITSAAASCGQTGPQVTLNWTSVPNSTEYRVYRSDKPLTILQTVGGTQTSFVDTTVASNASYSYAVTSYNPTTGESLITSWTQITNSSGGSTTPDCTFPAVAIQTTLAGCYTPANWPVLPPQPVTAISQSSVGTTSVKYRLTNLDSQASKEFSALTSSPPGAVTSTWQYQFNGTSDLETIGSSGHNYKLEVSAVSGSGNSSPYSNNTPKIFGYRLSCVTPWVQTKSGDVHSNININTPGGP